MSNYLPFKQLNTTTKMTKIIGTPKELIKNKLPYKMSPDILSSRTFGSLDFYSGGLNDSHLSNESSPATSRSVDTDEI